MSPAIEKEHLEPEQFIEMAFIETFDSPLLEILRKEQKKAGLSSCDIRLLLPEDPEYRGSFIAKVSGKRQEGYEIVLVPGSLEKWGYSLQEAIRHELAHIKHGDLDKKRMWPVSLFYNRFLKERRAVKYAFKERLPAYYY